ncbi:coenzyme F420-0:L-glutamate ligase [Phytoactinopolyspora limicola]|uniref:coenzyme F420-0:L-glutamate ligase n=1 Tax=Phytoactinopolyspora limicola TaxID=2715536 RepID=UPI001409DF7B|nr:coenzyme F420-0:L-glutamate ligase [Phytoactinopolyspora limicola]
MSRRSQRVTDTSALHYEVRGIPGIPEVRPGDDLAGLLIQALSGSPQSAAAPTGPAPTGPAPTGPARTTADDEPPALADGDIVVVTSKIVSKAEGRIRTGVDRDAAIDDEAVRTISEWTTPRGRTRIVETRHGFVMAAAGVDASNVEPGTVVLLPEDPDASAHRLRNALRERLGVRVGVVLTDTAGRVWRNGVTDMAIGAAGIHVVDDLRGSVDPYGNDLGVTVVAVADELAAASELVRAKLSGVPVAIVRGLGHLLLPDGAPDPGGSALVRPSADDRFRLGTPEAMREAVTHRRTVTTFAAAPVGPDLIRRAIDAARIAPHPGLAESPARFVVVESDAAHKALADVVRVVDPEAATILAGAPRIVIPCSTDTSTEATLALGAAVENVLIALAADGLGSAWLLPPVDQSDATTALDLPAGLTPYGAIALGHPASPAH